MDSKELAKLIDLLRKKGVKSFKDGEFSIELSHEAPPSNYKRKQEFTPETMESENSFNEEDALFWSSAGLPEEAN